MQYITLPEFWIAIAIFIVSLSIYYVIWYILFGKRFPMKNSESTIKQNKGNDTCTLNDIMGYDFIQIKTIQKEQAGREEISPLTTTNDTPEKPGVYATSNTHEYLNDITSEPYPIPEPEKTQILELTEDDMEIIVNEPWEVGLDKEEQEAMANYYASQPDFACDDSEDNTEFTEQEMQHEAEFDKYCDDFYSMMEKFTTTPEDQKALMDLEKELNKSDDNNDMNNSIPEENDIPEI